MTTMTPPATARVFKSGNSQAIRLPKEFRVDSPVLEISRRGEEIVLRPPKPKERNLVRALELLRSMGENGLVVERENDFPQIREEL